MSRKLSTLNLMVVTNHKQHYIEENKQNKQAKL